MLDAVLTVLATAAPGEEESSKALFYIAGALLALFAVAVSVLGIKRKDTFPGNRGQSRGVMALAAVLVLFTMAAAIITG